MYSRPMDCILSASGFSTQSTQLTLDIVFSSLYIGACVALIARQAEKQLHRTKCNTEL